MSIEEIESITFDEIGSYPYRLKRISQPPLLMNIHGCIYIEGEYYQKIAVHVEELGYKMYFHPARKSIRTSF